MLPAALSFALLGSIESLLSAVVADSMTGRRHRSNAELVAQGVGQYRLVLFGGICVTGTIARTATNVRAGARGPIAGMLHALFLLLFMLVAAPLAGYIPLAALAAVLAVVCWNMAEKHSSRRSSAPRAAMRSCLLATFLLVVFRDLTEGILIGFALGTLLFLHRMAQSVEVESGARSSRRTPRWTGNGRRQPYDVRARDRPDIVVYRISGAFFFGAAASVAAALDRIGEHPKAYVIDFSAVSIIDSTAAATIEGFVRKARRGAYVYIAAAAPCARRALLSHGSEAPAACALKAELGDALSSARQELDTRGADDDAATARRVRLPLGT